MQLYITNTSRHPAKAVRWLAHYAARYVRSEAEREGWLAEFDRHGISLRIGHTSRHWAGHYAYTKSAWAIPRFNRKQFSLPEGERLHDVLCKVGNRWSAPVRWSYDFKWRDMPEMMVADWQEALVALVAHELSHMKANGLKAGETYCDLTACDCVDQFRKDRADYDTAMQSHERREQSRELALAAKRDPQAVNATALAKATRKLEQWTRKSKLAGTKLKQYSRLVKRLSKRAEALATAGN